MGTTETMVCHTIEEYKRHTITHTFILTINDVYLIVSTLTWFFSHNHLIGGLSP